MIKFNHNYTVFLELFIATNSKKIVIEIKTKNDKIFQK